MFNSAALAEFWEGSIRWSLKRVQFQTSWLLQHWGDLGRCLVGQRFWKSSKLRGTGIRSQWIYNRGLWGDSNGVIELLENIEQVITAEWKRPWNERWRERWSFMLIGHEFDIHFFEGSMLKGLIWRLEPWVFFFSPSNPRWVQCL